MKGRTTTTGKTIGGPGEPSISEKVVTVSRKKSKRRRENRAVAAVVVLSHQKTVNMLPVRQ